MSCRTKNDWLVRRAWLAGVVCTLVCLPVQRAMATDKKRPALRAMVDLSRVDLERRCLELRLSRPAARATLKVVGPEEKVLAEVERHFQGVEAGVPLVLQWPEHPPEPIVRIEVFGYDIEGYFKGVAVTPWSAEVPHQQVRFASGSAKIRSTEEGKLQSSLERIAHLLAKNPAVGKVQLYVVAHTDTVGKAEDNQRLSERRAGAIARWFQARGLALPIVFGGLGERALKVPTEDNVPDATNRRVDFWLSAQPPRWGDGGVIPQWHRL